MKKSGFQFTDPHIVNLQFSINEEFEEEKFEGFGIESEVSNAVIEENREAFVRLRLFIGQNDASTPFVCNIEMVGKFKVEEETSPEFFQSLLDANAPALLMSYARPIVSIVTAQAGFPSFNIPFVNFMGKPDIN